MPDTKKYSRLDSLINDIERILVKGGPSDYKTDFKEVIICGKNASKAGGYIKDELKERIKIVDFNNNEEISYLLTNGCKDPFVLYAKSDKCSDILFENIRATADELNCRLLISAKNDSIKMGCSFLIYSDYYLR